MAISADDRLCALKELRSVTSHTSFVFGKVGYVRKGAHLLPICGRSVMTGLALALMLFGRVREARVIAAIADSGGCLCAFWLASLTRDLTSRKKVFAAQPKC